MVLNNNLITNRKIVPQTVVNFYAERYWEISLKYGMGKLELQGCSPEELPEVASAMQLELLHPSAEELASFHRLPRVVHKDPFDRLIVWQALQNKLHLISKDQRLSEYQSLGLKVIW